MRIRRHEAVVSGILRGAGHEIARVRPLCRNAAVACCVMSPNGRKHAIASVVHCLARPSRFIADGPR